MRVTNSTLGYVILTLVVLVMASAFAMAPGLTSADLWADHIGYMLGDHRSSWALGMVALSVQSAAWVAHRFRRTAYSPENSPAGLPSANNT